MKHGIKTVAVVLPVGKSFDELFDHSIKPALEKGKVKWSRVSPEFSDSNTLGKTCAELERVDLVLADITAKNPNTMYLAGYAHGIGKRVLLLALHGEDFPFDRNRHEVIIHGGSNETLRSELGNFLKSGSVSEAQSGAGSQSTGTPRNKFLAIFGDLLAQHGHEHKGPIEMENEKTFILIQQDMELALVQDLARRGRELGIRIKLM